MIEGTAIPRSPRWLHAWALLTVCATLVLLVLGSLVTTRRAGMADPVWPTTPWHLAMISWEEPVPGFLLEHSHRLAGYVVGCCVIVLMLGLGRADNRPWMKTLGMTALLLVIVQGLIGGFRVFLDRQLGTDLAFIHGSLAQIVFAALVTIAFCTAPSWFDQPMVDNPRRGRTKRLALAVSIFVYLQVVLGAFLRHTYSSLGTRGHFLGAFLVVGSVAWLCKEVWEHQREDRVLFRWTVLLAGLVIFQILLGVEAWMSRYTAMGVGSQVMLRTTHVMIGFLIFSASVVINMQARRRLSGSSEVSSRTVAMRLPTERLEGVL